MPSVTMSGGRFSIRVSYETSQDVQNNCSAVTVTRVEVQSNAGDEGKCWLSGIVSVQGEDAVWLELSGAVQCAATLGNGFSGRGEGWPGWHGKTVRVVHREDGTQDLKINVSIEVYNTKAQMMGAVYSSDYRSLPSIPRAAGIMAAGGTLGIPMNITLNRVSSLSNTLTWQCGSASGTIASNTLETNFTWTPPVELAWQATGSPNAEVVLTVVSYSGGIQAGSRSLTVYCPVPLDLVPTLTANAEDAFGYAEHFGGYIQNKSRVRIRTQAEGCCGSVIRTVRVEFGGLTAQGTDVSFVPTAGGDMTIRVTVEDSRGRTAVQTLTVSVLPYSPPRIEIQSLDRCDADGNYQRDGGYAKVVFSGSLTELDGKNRAQYTLRRCIRGGSQKTDIPMTSLENLLNPNRVEYVFPASVDQDYECWVLLADAFENTQSSQAALSVAFALLDFNRNTKAVGIGRRAGEANTVSVGLQMRLHGHRITDLADPQENRDAVPRGWLEALYPVGAVYLSASNVCVPQVLFGGTWQRIEDRFLLASGPSHASGSTGGASEVSLTLAQIPGHRHAQRYGGMPWTDPDGDGGGTAMGNMVEYHGDYFGSVQTTDYAGGGQAHNNMPPYLAVNMWVRTA